MRKNVKKFWIKAEKTHSATNILFQKVAEEQDSPLNRLNNNTLFTSKSKKYTGVTGDLTFHFYQKNLSTDFSNVTSQASNFISYLSSTYAFDPKKIKHFPYSGLQHRYPNTPKHFL